MANFWGTFKRNHSMLPLLVLLFCVSYGILTMLVVEQGRTIDNQKGLIEELFKDSSQLTAMKMQQNAAHAAAAKNQKPAAKAPATPRTEIQAAPTVVSPKDLQTQAQVNSGNSAKPSQRMGKLRRRAPLHPPKGVAEEGDERRALSSI